MAERILSEIVELDVDKCQNTYGVTPCTAGRKDSGTAQAGTANTITLRAGASAVNDFYKTMVVRITGGTGAGQEGVITAYVGATKVATVSANWAVIPDATSTYDVIDRPNACYNAFRTCQDKPNYVKGTQTLRFTGQGSPIPIGVAARPYVANIARAVTKLDPEEGLAVRSSSTVTLADETDADVETDPYVRNRAAPAGGTFWTRFFARNLNYIGRAARIKKAFVDHGVFGAATTERFVIDSMKGPNGKGEVTLVLKDPTRLLDKTKAPTPSSGKLAADLQLVDMQLTLQAGQGSQYASTGYVRIGDEVIRYDLVVGDVLSWSASSFRAVFGTDAAVHKAGDLVQQCLVYSDVAFGDVIHDLYSRAGILDADIDLAGLAAEDLAWLSTPYRVSTVITDPEPIANLVKELLQQAQMMAWWSATAQQHKFKVYAPASPGAVVTKTLDDTAYLIERSVESERLEAKRISLCGVYSGRYSVTANLKEAKNYRKGELTIDADAESANEYNERVAHTIYSRWFGAGNEIAMQALAQRRVGRYRDAPENISRFFLDPKDGDVVEGQIIDVRTQGRVDFAGNVKTARVLVTSRKDQGTHIEYSARITTFDRRYGFIAPAGTADYPNNNGYACVCSAAGLMADGTDGFLVI